MKCAAVLMWVALNLSFCLQSQAESWQPINHHLEQLRLPLTTRGMFRAELLFFRTRLEDYALTMLQSSHYGAQALHAESILDRSGATFVINGSFFDEHQKPLGLIITRGTIAHGIHKGGSALTGIFGITRKEPFIVHRGQFSTATVTEAVQAGPRVLAQGKVVPGLKESLTPTHRSGVCIDAEKRIVFYITQSELFGVDLSELTQALLRPSIGCVDALNLDGGGSSQAAYHYKPQTKAASSKVKIGEMRDEVPIFIGLIPRRVD
jgi:uncharacterized protein YigE (DUF2233 family)